MRFEIVMTSRPIARLLRRCGLGGASVIVFPLWSANAQGGPGPSANPAADREAVVQDSTAGLGWMYTESQDGVRYAHPRQCLAAIEIAQRMTVSRTQWVRPSPAGDTLSTAARTIGQSCAAKFSLRTASPRDLIDYFALAAKLDDVALAMRIVETRFAAAKTPNEKGSVLVDATADLNMQSPAQVAAADSLTGRIDALGPRARWWRIRALQYLQSHPFATALSPSLATTFDTTRYARITHALAEQYIALSHDERLLAGVVATPITNPWLYLQEYRRVPPDRLCRQAEEELLREGGTDSVRGTAATDLLGFARERCPAIMGGIGKPVASFTGGDWFMPGDTIAKQSLGYPRPGRVTLVFNDAVGAGRPSAALALYRRFYEKYADSGLDVILVHQRKGLLWQSDWLPITTETKLIRWYDHDYLKLPFPIVVYDSAATNVPQTTFIGRDGRVYAATPQFYGDEAVFDAFVRQALAEPGGEARH